jgi:hypothetical protein
VNDFRKRTIVISQGRLLADRIEGGYQNAGEVRRA